MTRKVTMMLKNRFYGVRSHRKCNKVIMINL